MKDFKFEIPHQRSAGALTVVRRALLAAFFLLPAVFLLLPPPFFKTAHCSLPAAHWTRQKSGTFAWLRAVFFVDARRGWAVGGKGALLETRDGGATWETRRVPVEDAIHDVFFTDEQTGWLVCERSIFLLKTKDDRRSYLLRTRDGGADWERVEVGSADAEALVVGVRFADRERGWAFGEMGALYKTEDGGATWARQRVPTRHLLLGATFLDARTGWLVGAGSTLLRTEDGGATWQEGRISAPTQQLSSSTVSAAQTPAPARAPSVRVNAVSFVDARRGWAAGSGGTVLATADGGRTWRAQATNVASDLFDVKFFDASEGWAAGADGALIHTTDGGATWELEQTGTPHRLERLFFAGRARGWAVGFGGTIIAFSKG
jgi:photosystem II stability/assembly factor-like uncharacterized protein